MNEELNQALSRVRSAAEALVRQEGARRREREELLRLVTEHTVDVLSIVNADGTLRYGSPANGRVTGYERGQLEGRSVFDAMHPEDVPAVRRAFRQCIESPGIPVQSTFRFRHRDGHWVVLEARAQAVRLGEDEDGAATLAGAGPAPDDWEERRRLEALEAPARPEPELCVLVNARDVTQRVAEEAELRRRAEQAEQLSEILAELGAAKDLQEAACVLGQGALKLLRGTQVVVRFFDPLGRTGFLSAEVSADGRHSVNLVGGPPRPGSYAARLLAGGPPVVVQDYRAHDPSYPFYEELRAQGLRSAVNVPLEVGGRRIGSLHVNHPEPGAYGPVDLTLALTLAVRAGAVVERLRSQAMVTEQSRLDGALLVARTAAHEINNALAPVTGYADLLATHPLAQSDPKVAEYVREITRAADDTAAKVARLQRVIRLERTDHGLGSDWQVLDLDKSTQSPTSH